VYLQAFRDANNAVFKRNGVAPQELKDACEFIESLFAMKDWQSALDLRKESLQAILNREPLVDLGESAEDH
jgi:hypothetical protein